MALVLLIMMFSMAGIPPFAGFWGKLYVFMAAIDAKLYVLAVVGVLSSVVAAYYYIRIIKLMYFDEPADAFDRMPGRELGLIQVAAAAFTLFFFLFPGPLVRAAEMAVKSLGG